MPQLAPLNWVLIFFLINFQLFLSTILLWWTFFPQYKFYSPTSSSSSYLLPFKI